ncbi:ABC transporter ATP-binding protein [Actibacterium pelagium]|uniref:Sugar ABC transporter ATP-binding protein n=1 Tax=Actibacterium pelagium TaxID=2029103 RepID=A0A917AME0_9RHOB|nr:ABC transporter ATP-binding protein [Actibacterium pelagium]GGE61737.1 sugar ABC transporter ATP-binding protein [Actibacterium pelagium]
MADVRFTRFRKAFGSVEVIPELDLHVPDGSFTVLVGPSGCGKSTLLRSIAGLEEASSGAIEIGGEDVTHLDPAERGVAMVFQSYALYPHMTVRENIGFGLKLSGLPKEEIAARVEEAASTLQLTHLLERKPKALSGGQRQRVAIGRAIVRKPRVFLFDEPLSNLDASLRGQMRVELAELHSRLGATMVYVTHDQVEAMTLADQIVVLNGGKIEQVGAPMELYQKPKTPFVAGFIGSPTMNFVEGAPAKALGGAKIGIRPEHIDITQGGGMWTGQLRHVEHLGGETLAYVEVPGIGSMTVKREGDTQWEPGQQVHLTPREGCLHVF